MGASSQTGSRIASLSDVDHEVLVLLCVHRVLTTSQLITLTGRPERTVDYRLARLRAASLLGRTRPYAASESAPFYWWLTRAGARLIEGTSPAPGKGDPNPLFLRHTAAGAMVVAAERGKDPDKSRWRAGKALAIGKSQRLGHLVGVNGFFSALLAESRRREDCGLSLWWSERQCANQFDRIAQPDGLGRWEEAGNRVVFCLEYDRSTETLERLEKKLKSYEDLQVASGHAYWICFSFGHPRREAGARRVLAQATVPVATAALGPTQRPHEAIWAPIGYSGVRLRLAELASVPIPPESEERVAETQAYRRRAAAQ